MSCDTGMTESMLVARKRAPCWTEDKDETWVGLDLGAKRLLSVTHYALCNGAPEPGKECAIHKLMSNLCE